MQKTRRNRSKVLMSMTVAFFVFLFLIIDLLIGLIMIPNDYSSFRVRHSWYHHGLKGDVSSKAAWGPIIYPFFSNNLGFRDLSDRKVPLSSDSERILILGDSHSEGVGIDYQFTFAGRMQQYLADKNVEVLNASAVSYSPKIHYLKGDYLLNHIGLEVDEVWVIIDISDLQNEIAYEPFIPRMPGFFRDMGYWTGRFLKQHSFTFFSLTAIRDNRAYEQFKETLLAYSDEIEQLPTRNAIELYRDFFRSFDDQALLRDPNFHGVSAWIYDKSLREFADQGLNLGMENISLLHDICRQKNIRMRLSVHPWQTQVMKGDTTDYYVERWRSFCYEEGIAFINLYPLFITHENPLWVARTCYIEGDNHWNEMGHARVAHHFIKLIDQDAP